MAGKGADILLASQPIFNRRRELFGAELLFRNADQQTAKDFGDDRATSSVLANYFGSVLEQSQLLRKPVFINISRSMLLSEAFFPITPDRVVVELLETIEVTPEVVSAVRNWRKAGFQFALDDFEFDPSWSELIPLAEYVKVDVLGRDPGELIAKRTKYQVKGQKWLAERVENHEVFQAYLDGGFDLFQGYFLGRPRNVLGREIRPDQASAFEVMQAINQPEIDINQLSSVIERSPNMAMQFLKIINSPACSLNREITSIRETVVFLGLAQVRKWAIILCMLDGSSCESSVQRLVLIRARCMELLGNLDGRVEPAACFMTGLVSGVDLLLGIEKPVFLEQVRLPQEIHQAVSDGAGLMGKYLRNVLILEQRIMSEPERLLGKSEKALQAYVSATNWADTLIQEIVK